MISVELVKDDDQVHTSRFIETFRLRSSLSVPIAAGSSVKRLDPVGPRFQLIAHPSARSPSTTHADSGAPGWSPETARSAACPRVRPTQESACTPRHPGAHTRTHTPS